MSEPPTHAYFRPKHGQWTGRLVFELLNLRALFAGDASLGSKLSFLAMTWACRLFGPFRIDTSVDAAELGRGEVLHTTRVSKFGVTVFSSVERFHLHDDGRTFDVTGAQRRAPFSWIEEPYLASRGEVDADGLCASYAFAWPGHRITQQSSPGPDGLAFVQQTDGCRGAFVLTPRT